MPTGSAARPSCRSQAAPYHDLIQAGVDAGLTAERIFEDPTFEHGYAGSYDSVKRYVRKLALDKGVGLSPPNTVGG